MLTGKLVLSVEAEKVEVLLQCPIPKSARDI